MLLLRRTALAIALLGAGLGVAQAQSVPADATSTPAPATTPSSPATPLPRVLPEQNGSDNWAHSTAPSYNWYIAPRLGIVVPDHDRGVRDSALGGVSVGRWIGPKVTVDLDYTINNADFTHRSGRYGHEWENVGLGVTGRWYTGQAADANRFYVLGGVGAMRHAGAPGGESGWSPSATAGVGYQHAFNDRVAMRAEVAARYDRDNTTSKYVPTLNRENHYVDGVASVALVIGLGHKPAPPEPYVSYHQDLAPKPDCSQQFRNGVNLCENKCPDLPEGTIVGPDGCPKAVVIDLHGVNFKFDRPRPGETDVIKSLAPPTSDSQAILDQAVDLLNRYPQVHVKIVGYTDAIGTDAYNQKLSERRAQAVTSYLEGHGIAQDRIDGVSGMGKNDPVAPNDTPEGRARNRRVELQPQDGTAPANNPAPATDQTQYDPPTQPQQ